MTMSIRVVSAGSGHAYLLKSVVKGDGERSAPDDVSRYYAEAGTPPGRWIGSGVANLARGALAEGDAVTPEHLQRLIGVGRDPVTGQPLGGDYRIYPTIADRIGARIARLDRNLPPDERAQAEATIRSEEARKGDRKAVAGFDLTFSVPKSVSVLWGLADAHTQSLIVAAHHAAVREMLDLLERHVATTRSGHDGIEQLDVAGVAGTAYDHWDSRSNDPQLHTHVVVSNKVLTRADKQWRTLDSRALHNAVVALSAHYDAILRDRLTGTFGLAWEHRARGVDRNPQWEIAAVPDALIGEFSSRSRLIDTATDALIADHVAQHGRRPTARTVAQLRAQATLATRPEKQVHSLHDLTSAWRERATGLLGCDATQWARGVSTSGTARTIAAQEVPDDVVVRLAQNVVATVSGKRATWKHWNLWAEAERQTMGLRFATAADREALVARVVSDAETASVRLTPPELAPSPTSMTREDGTSRLRPRHSAVFTAEHVLAAEGRLVARADDATALIVGDRRVAAVLGRRGVRLSGEQRAAVRQIARSGRRLDLFVGPAGSGKTTTMRALRAVWEKGYGRGSVVGLAPSAVAAKVLADDLGIACENTAKWLWEHDRGRAMFRAGQLVIVDEATLAGTAALDRITALADAAGAKVLLVGDPAQLQSVDAGGAFSMLVEHLREQGATVAEVTEVHRFRAEWERAASLRLRVGDAEVLDAYDARDRLRGGTTEEMIDAAYAAWQADVDAGLGTLLVAEAGDVVRELNERARADRILSGATSDGASVTLGDGLAASVGDVVITRRNDRRLRTRRGFVRNGDRWTVVGVGRDGSLAVRRAGGRGTSVVLPAEYVAENVDLGYAVTAHRVQGLTVDTAHVLVTASTTRENLYVAMTRGRTSNVAYVGLDRPDDQHVPPAPGEATILSVLNRVLEQSGAEVSARQTLRAERQQWGSVDRFVAEYEYIAQVAQQPRWTAAVTRALIAGGLPAGDVGSVLGTTAFDALCAELRRAEAYGYAVERLVVAVAAARSLLDADDPCAALHDRLARVTARPANGRQLRMVGGRTPEALGPMAGDARAALEARARLIEGQGAPVLRGDTDALGDLVGHGLPDIRRASAAAAVHPGHRSSKDRERKGVHQLAGCVVVPGELLIM